MVRQYQTCLSSGCTSSSIMIHELQKYRDLFDCKIKIVAGDTDSFFLEVKNVNLRNVLLPKMKDDGLLDTSNYQPTDPLYSKSLVNVIGKYKDESKGLGFTEGIFLCLKCYSLEGSKLRHRFLGQRHITSSVFNLLFI